MSVSRRKALALLGGGAILAAGTGGALWASTRTPLRALEPWEDAQEATDPRIAALSYAILAPNPHNLQPWLVDLEGTDGALLYRDPTKALPMTDPMDRQVIIGLGCFLEQARIAATMTGHSLEIDLWPEGEDGPVARMRLSDGAARDPLADAIMDRRSCKEPFDGTALTAPGRAAVAAEADMVIDAADEVARIREIAGEAWRAELYTPRTLKESIDLLRIGRREIEANPDGIDLGGPMFEALEATGLMTREQAMDTESTAFRQQLASLETALQTTPAFAAIVGADTPEGRIDAGRRYLRMNLAATAAGVSVHPISQALQEYPEVSGPHAAIHALLAPGGGTVHMLARIGYGPEVPRTPRWPLEAKMI